MFGRRRSAPESPSSLELIGWPRRRLSLWVLLNRLIVLGLVLAFINHFGLPHLRTHYSYRGTWDNPIIVEARYWSVSGSRELGAGDLGDQMPLIVLIPLERPLWVHAREFWISFNAEEKL